MTKHFTPASVGRLDLPAPQVIETRLGPVHCSVSGTGPAVLAIHGGMGGWDQSWLLARALFSGAVPRRVIAVSRPGFFGTPLAGHRDAPAQADVLAALLDSLGEERALVAAISAGGPSALHFTLRHPGRCSGLILVSAASGGFAVPERVIGRLRLMRVLAAIPGLLPMLVRRMAGDLDAVARRSIPDDALRRATLEDPEAGPLFRTLLNRLTVGLRQRLPGTIADTESFAALPPIPFEAVTVPSLILHGDADSVVPTNLAREAARRMPDARLVELAGGDHVALFTHLREVRQAMDGFIGELSI